MLCCGIWRGAIARSKTRASMPTNRRLPPSTSSHTTPRCAAASARFSSAIRSPGSSDASILRSRDDVLGQRAAEIHQPAIDQRAHRGRHRRPLAQHPPQPSDRDAPDPRADAAHREEAVADAEAFDVHPEHAAAGGDGQEVRPRAARAALFDGDREHLHQSRLDHPEVVGVGEQNGPRSVDLLDGSLTGEGGPLRRRCDEVVHATPGSRSRTDLRLPSSARACRAARSCRDPSPRSRRSRGSCSSDGR